MRATVLFRNLNKEAPGRARPAELTSKLMPICEVGVFQTRSGIRAQQAGKMGFSSTRVGRAC